MTWDYRQPSDALNGAIDIAVDRLIYEYDGPQVFTARLGFVYFLFLKVDELEESDLYLASPLDNETLALVLDIKVSLRAAFERDLVYLVEARGDLSVMRYWTCRLEDVPGEFFPGSHSGLVPNSIPLPNTVAQVEAFIAMGFEGPSLTRSGMPFSTFKVLPEQCRAARAWLNWSQSDLAEAARVALSTVKDYEGGRRTPIANNLAAIRAALEAKGIVFVGEKDAGTWGITYAQPKNAGAH